MTKEEFEPVWQAGFASFRRSVTQSLGTVESEWWERFEAAWKAPIRVWFERFPPCEAKEEADETDRTQDARAD